MSAEGETATPPAPEPEPRRRAEHGVESRRAHPSGDESGDTSEGGSGGGTGCGSGGEGRHGSRRGPGGGPIRIGTVGQPPPWTIATSSGATSSGAANSHAIDPRASGSGGSGSGAPRMGAPRAPGAYKPKGFADAAPPTVTPRYDASRFVALEAEADARRIILTDDRGVTSAERWAAETPALTAEIVRHLDPWPDALLLDFGAGIGRLAKALIERTGCAVLGADLSAPMRRMALDHVGGDRYTSVSPTALRAMVRGGLRVDHAVAVWVLQHCRDPRVEIDLLAQALKPGGMLYVVNTLRRCVPGRGSRWYDDGLDVADLLRARLREVARGQLPAEATTPHIRAYTYWMLCRKS